eukprot:Em0008g1114a
MQAKAEFPAKVPLAVGRVQSSQLPELTNYKILFPSSVSVGDLCTYLNGKLKRSDNAPLYIYVAKDTLLSRLTSIDEVYQEYRDDDYFLYLAYYEVNIHLKR